MFHLLCKESTMVGDVKMLWLHCCFRFWDACNLKKKGNLIGFDMVLLDEKSNLIQDFNPNVNNVLSDIFGELSEYQYHLINESQSTQNVMITIQMDKITTVCVSVFDKVSTILHEKLVVLDLEPKAMVESLQPTQSQNSWRSPIPKYYLKDALLLRQQKRSHSGFFKKSYVDVRKDPLLLLANMVVLRNSRLTHFLCLIAMSSIHPHMHFHSLMTNDLTPISAHGNCNVDSIIHVHWMQ
ncbi:hypothetical protein Bca4012_093279 [Brassica carinata]